jgi:hypothetical protein
MLVRVSWMLLLRGGLCAASGAIAMVARDFTVLVRVLRVYAVADGILAIALGRARESADKGARCPLWPLTLSGSASLAAGTAALSVADPLQGLTAVAMGLFTRGVFDALAAIALRDAGYDERLLGVAATSTLVTGAIAATCDVGILTWRILLATHSGVTAGSIVALALRVRVPLRPVVVRGEFRRPRATARALRRLRRREEPPAAAR